MDVPAALALLNLGATELALVLVLFILLFGVDKIPGIARSLGRVQARWSRARSDFERELKSAEERELDALYAFERQREAQIRSTSPAFMEEQRVRDAARAMGIDDADTASLPELRKRLAARVAGDANVTGP